MIRILESKRLTHSSVPWIGLFAAACVAVTSCLESTPPDLDPQHLSLVAAPLNLSFEGVYRFGARTVTIAALPQRRYRVLERSSDGAVTEWTVRFVALDPQTSGLTLPPGGQAYVAVLTDRVPSAGLLGAIYDVLVFDPQSVDYLWRAINVREENRLGVESVLQPVGLGPVSSPRLRMMKRGGGSITAAELRALRVAALPLEAEERLERVTPTTPAPEARSNTPRADPIANTYASAPFLTAKGLMGELRVVRLLIHGKDELFAKVPMASLRSVVEHQLNRRGIIVNDLAPITAKVTSVASQG